jgi:hypothetical protein
MFDRKNHETILILLQYWFHFVILFFLFCCDFNEILCFLGITKVVKYCRNWKPNLSTIATSFNKEKKSAKFYKL